MTIEFGLLTNPTVDILKEIETIARLEFDFVEIGIEWPEGEPEVLLRKRDQILRLLNQYNLFAVGHTTWWIDFATPYIHVRKGWIKEAKRKIDVANKLGIKLLNFHSHAREIKPFYKRYRQDILKNFIVSLKEIITYAKSKNIQIMLENAVEKGEIASFKDFKFIADKISDLKIHLDIGHAFVSGGMRDVERYISYFRDRIVHLHMHDNHGKEDEHLPIGKGKINFARVVKLLKKINYDKTVTFEVFTSKRDAVKSREKIKKLWNKY